MSGAEGALAIGGLCGPWALHLHGAEQDAVKIVSTMIRVGGMVGVTIGYIFLFIFFYKVVTIYYADKKIIRNKTREQHNEDEDCDDESLIYYAELSEGVQKTWKIMKWLTFIAAIFGSITFILTTVLNEGFYNYRTGSTSVLIYSMLFFGLGGGCITLAVIIGYYIIKWPKTNPINNLDDLGNPKVNEFPEDEKLFNIIKPTATSGITLAVLYCINIITIFITEWDEDAARDAKDNYSFLGGSGSN